MKILTLLSIHKEGGVGLPGLLDSDQDIGKGFQAGAAACISKGEAKRELL